MSYAAIVETVREFGFPVAMAITFCISLIWALKIFVKHFMDSLRDANVERRDMVNKFAQVLENHISHNTQALGEVCGQLKEMASDHREFAVKLEALRSKQ